MPVTGGVQHLKHGTGCSSAAKPGVLNISRVFAKNFAANRKALSHNGRNSCDRMQAMAAAVADAVPKMTKKTKPAFPFVKLAGQDDMKLALLLNVVDPAIGGVLIMGDRGCGKSVAVRSLVDLLPMIDVVVDDPFNSSPTDPKLMGPYALERARAGETLPGTQMRTPLVELPLGATEDRICGTIDIEKALTEGIKVRYRIQTFSTSSALSSCLLARVSHHITAQLPHHAHMFLLICRPTSPGCLPRPTAAFCMLTRSTFWTMVWWMWCWTLLLVAKTLWSAKASPSFTLPSSS